MAGAYRSPKTEYAMRLVKEGLSYADAALKADVHRTTVFRALNPKKKKKVDK